MIVKRLIVKSVERSVNIPATRIEEKLGVIYAFDGNVLVGCFSSEAVDMLYLSETKDAENGH